VSVQRRQDVSVPHVCQAVDVWMLTPSARPPTCASALRGTSSRTLSVVSVHRITTISADKICLQIVRTGPQN